MARLLLVARRMPRTPALLLLSLSLACAGEDPDDRGSGGKADDLTPAPDERCDFDVPSPFGGLSLDLERLVLDTRELVAEDAGELDALTSAQLIAAGMHLAELPAGATVADVFDATDDGLIERFAIGLPRADGGVDHSVWYRMFAGDTEIGVVFADGTIDLQAEISDGDLMGCEAPAAD